MPNMIARVHWAESIKLDSALNFFVLFISKILYILINERQPFNLFNKGDISWELHFLQRLWWLLCSL